VAKVLLIIDHNSTIAVLIQRSRSRGILEGRTEDLCELKYVTRTGDVKKGDTVISSGLGGFYPKGILVGRVSKVEKRKYGIFQKVMVIPSVDFSRVEEVFIVTGS
jgi:rod shape-determining protein MreC